MRLVGVSHSFETPIKGCKVMGSFVLLAGFELSVGMYGYTLPALCFPDCS